MILLKYKGEKLEFRLTKTPISNTQASPSPTGKKIGDLDPKAVNYSVEKKAILNHPNYSDNEVITLKPGLNKFENEEHAEYLYKILGNPENGGVVTYSDGTEGRIINKNILIQVDEKGEEVKGELYKKYRQPLRNPNIKQ